MTYRELFQQIMFYGEFDRMPVIHWKGWPETYERWHAEGMPEGVDEHEFFGTVPQWRGVHVNVNLHPAFEEEVLEETDEYRILRNWEGAVMQDWKHKSCIPHFVDFTFKTAADWPEYKKRLQPDPARVPDDIDERIRWTEESGLPIIVGTASMMGWFRNWMGVQNFCYLQFDDQDCLAEMVDTLSDLVCWSLDQVCPRMSAPPDMGFGWEDICGKSGPLVSPDVFDRCIAPGYRKIRDKLESHGVKLYGIDSDGMVEPLVPNWLEAGVNVQFPLEPGTWGADPADMRRKFGRELRIVGGYNKLVLEKDRAAIDAELARHMDIMREGGYIVMPDHLITPDTPLENYLYYLDRVRELRL